MNINSEKIDRLRELLAAPSQNIVILSHVNPDGDAVGSSLALAGLFEGMGHTATCIVPNKFPYFLDWLPDVRKLLIYRQNEQRTVEAVEAADIIVCADMNMLSRLEGLSDVIASNTRARRVLVDHHLQPDEGFDVLFSYPDSSSTAFVAYSIIEQIAGAESITLNMATQLYVGIMTDTGNFAFSFLTPELFRAVAVLLERGIDIPTIHNNVYNAYTEGRARLFGYAINRKLKTLRKGTVAYMSLTEEEMRRFWFQQGDSEGFVNYALTIKKMKMSALFSEQHDFVRVSLRSRGAVDVDKFARKYFNGGGHKNAAGGKSYLPIDQTIQQYIDAVEEFASEGEL